MKEEGMRKGRGEDDKEQDDDKWKKDTMGEGDRKEQEKESTKQ